ncbi:hypothetical protein [Vibrio diabolicus]|uniref:hypothetical protein n=1 Tax=Vibrio diabolicus TaxID=50719 RepID=UPI0035A96CA6
MKTEELRIVEQEEKSLTAEGKLAKALLRLQEGRPVRTKVRGKLTLNKINNEAGLGRSYIHKFKAFVEEIANPAIEELNNRTDSSEVEDSSPETEDISEIDRLRAELKRERELKGDYRRERDEALAINTELEILNKSLMFRVFELQQELAPQVVEITSSKK